MAYRDPDVSSGDIAYHPSDGERIESYAERILQVCSQTRHNFIEHHKWWEHRGTKPCRICGLMDMCEYLTEALSEVNIVDKKAKWVYEWERTTQNPILHLHRTITKH